MATEAGKTPPLSHDPSNFRRHPAVEAAFMHIHHWHCRVSRLAWPAIVSVILVVSGCSHRYVPDVSLAESPETIDATVEYHPLQTARDLLSGHESFGVLAPKVTTASGRELTGQVENAVIEELAATHVFRRLTPYDPQPDLVLSGRINAFYEHFRPQLWNYAPGAGTVARLLRVNTHVTSGEADLTVLLLKPTGELVRQYTGRSSFRETLTPTEEAPPGERLNRALSEAVQQIRDKILKDSTLPRMNHRSSGLTR